ncbi:MAG: XamI family restriction endonuclease [Candidatus Sericytochromatia bacterium]|nr:XamI family restriction endonuclease [Candidatus Sericytochromatia bacterium]
MPANMHKSDWSEDSRASVKMYNEWYLAFAPATYTEARKSVTQEVKDALVHTDYFRNVSPELLRERPEVINILRMATSPPIARDRLVGLSGVSKSLVEYMEEGKVPKKVRGSTVEAELAKISTLIARLADPFIFPWLKTREAPNAKQIEDAATIITERYCGAKADPIIRNEQERRQLSVLHQWLNSKGYRPAPGGKLEDFTPGTYGRLWLPTKEVKVLENGDSVTLADQAEDAPEPEIVNVPIDTAIMPLAAPPDELPLLIEAKSAGDFANTNKRWKEEATKAIKMRATYGEDKIRYVLLLCGYFGPKYLTNERDEGIDWVWEHRVSDLESLGI